MGDNIINIITIIPLICIGIEISFLIALVPWDIHILNIFVVYLKLILNWVSCIFICYIYQLYHRQLPFYAAGHPVSHLGAHSPILQLVYMCSFFSSEKAKSLEGSVPPVYAPTLCLYLSKPLLFTPHYKYLFICMFLLDCKLLECRGWK